MGRSSQGPRDPIEAVVRPGFTNAPRQTEVVGQNTLKKSLTEDERLCLRNSKQGQPCALAEPLHDVQTLKRAVA